MARIELVRSGGFAGLRLQAVVDTTADEPDAGWYAEQLAALDLTALAARPAEATGRPEPDRFHYALAVDDDAGVHHALDFGEAALPDQLRPLVDRLERRARERGGA